MDYVTTATGVVLGAGRAGREPRRSPCTVTAALDLSDLATSPAAIAGRDRRPRSPLRSLALLTRAGVDAVRACHDPGELADDLGAATLLHRDHCAFVRPTWTFLD